MFPHHSTKCLKVTGLKGRSLCSKIKSDSLNFFWAYEMWVGYKIIFKSLSLMIPSIHLEIAAPIGNIYFRVWAKFAIWCPITDKAGFPQQRPIRKISGGSFYCPSPIFPIQASIGGHISQPTLVCTTATSDVTILGILHHFFQKNQIWPMVQQNNTYSIR